MMSRPFRTSGHSTHTTSTVAQPCAYRERYIIQYNIIKITLLKNTPTLRRSLAGWLAGLDVQYSTNNYCLLFTVSYPFAAYLLCFIMCMYLYVSVYVCVCVRMYIFIFRASNHISSHTIYIYVCMCMCIYMYVCVCVYFSFVPLIIHLHTLHMYVYVYMYVCVYVYISLSCL